MNITVPETTKSPATTVELQPDGEVVWGGQVLGRIERMEWSDTVVVWSAKALSADGKQYTSSFVGHHYPDHYRKNTRRGAIAHLLAMACTGNGYYHWKKD